MHATSLTRTHLNRSLFTKLSPRQACA
uniref:Uncharacterized protein n=1 Tax=Anguilla anguilla TaxID=7936 RepID=A0A0E9QNR9_ANGAN